MARPRLPTNVLALKGAFKKNPDRGRERADEPVPSEPLGDPPDTLSAAAKKCWREIAAVAHPGTLSSADRLVMEFGAQLLAMLRARKWDVPSQTLAQYLVFLSRLGLTPADRSRVSGIAAPPPKPTADPVDEFAPKTGNT